MNQTPTSMDCMDIRALLSGLIDDEVDAATRHRAERHLAECAACRGLLSDAEAIDDLVRQEAALLESVGGDTDEIIRRVLSRTVDANEHQPHYLRQWTTWAGWVAAAAAVALAMLIWVADRRAGLVGPGAVDRVMAPSGSVFTTRYPEVRKLRSWTLTDAEGIALDEPDQAASVRPVLLSGSSQTLSREDAEVLYLSSILVGMLADGEAPIDRVRRTLEYDQVLERLGRVAPAVSATDRPAVMAAEAVLLRAAQDPLDEQEIELMQQTVNDLELPSALEALSERWQPASV